MNASVRLVRKRRSGVPAGLPHNALASGLFAKFTPYQLWFIWQSPRYNALPMGIDHGFGKGKIPAWTLIANLTAVW